MLVSIIIPCYNQGAYIQDAIDSVKAQTYTNWEIIIVNDGSTENTTIEKLNSIKEDKISIYTQQNKGVSAARNFGTTKASGEFLLFLDGDDKIDKEYLQLALDAFKANSNLSYVYCDIQEFGESNYYRTLESLDLKKTLLHNQTHVSAIFTKKIWLASNGFDESFKQGWEDWDFIISLLKMEIVSYKIPKAMLYYRILKNSRDTNAVLLHDKLLQNKVYLKHLDLYIKYFDEPISVLRKVVSQETEVTQLNKKVNNIYNTISYKIGSTILFPLKMIKTFVFGKKVKVLFVTHNTSRSGAPLLLLNYLKWLNNESNIEPYTFIIQSDEMDSDFATLGKVFYPFNIKNSIGKNIFFKIYARIYNSNIGKKIYNLVLKYKLKFYNIDVIYSNTICNGSTMEFLNYLNIPQICHVHEGKVGIEIWGKENFDLVKKNATSYIACSNFVKNNLISNHDIFKEKIHLVYSAANKLISSNYNKPLQNNNEKIEEKKIYCIGGSGGLGKGKGTDLIVPLMKSLLKVSSDINFTWIGGNKDSNDFLNLQEDIINNGLSDNIKIISAVDNPIDYYLDLDIFILLSREDSFPLVCLENALVGNPILCFDTSGGATELLNECNENIIPFLDIEQMTIRVLYLLSNSIERKEIGKKIQEKVLANYTWDICFPKISEVIINTIQ